MTVDVQLISALPTVDTTTGFVISWELEIILSEDGFSMDYRCLLDVSEQNRSPASFSKSELTGLIPGSFFGNFDHTKKVHEGTYVPPSQTIEDFDINSLPS